MCGTVNSIRWKKSPDGLASQTWKLASECVTIGDWRVDGHDMNVNRHTAVCGEGAPGRAEDGREWHKRV